MKKNLLRIVLIVLMLFCMLLVIPSATIVAGAEIVTYELKDDKCLKPQEDGYLSEDEYQDPSIHVTIERGRIYDTNYVTARIKLSNASQLRSAMAQSYYSPSTTMGTTMARRVNAVFAINGDFFSVRPGEGYICRQGKVYRTDCDGERDVMILDENGDMHLFVKATNEDIESFEGTPINGYTFGPALVIDGVQQTDFADTDNGAFICAQRMCLAQVGELEYLCIASEGPEDPGSVGMTIEQFAELVGSFDDIIHAYNLDGGSSTTMVFQGDKINSPNNPKRRPLCDIIYFGSAYQPE